eukprot:scaffold9458_cov126-Skeletonema_menzelii.AAC.3
MNGSTSSHHPSLEDKILSHLQRRRRRSSNDDQSSAATRKEIQKELATKVASSSCDVSKKDVKRSLKRLVKQGDIVKDGKKYKIVVQSSSSAADEYGSDGDSRRSNDSSSLDHEKDVLERDDEFPGGGKEEAQVAPIVPIAERLRQKAQTEQLADDGNSKAKEKVDLDEEIRRLEAELAESDDNDDEDEESDYDDDSSNDDSKDGNITPKTDGIICLSSVADERIVPLPQDALPQNKRRTLKNIDAGENGEPKKSKKRKSMSSNPKEEHAISEGLKDAVNELLSNYVPSSHLKKPFYCRVCQHQSESESDFLSHKQSEFHKGAVQQEKKRTYCKLCRKQLTSIVQMEEHLKSRPHREKMDFVKSKQSGGGRSRSNGHGRDASGKQWC